MTLVDEAAPGLGALVARLADSLRACSLREVMTATATAPLPAELASYLERHHAALASWAAASAAAPAPTAPTAIAWHDAPVRFASERWAAWLHLRNQFLALPELAWTAADDLHRRAVQELRANLALPQAQQRRDAHAQTWASYLAGLVAWMAQYLGEDPREAVCAEYSAETQLRVLGIDLQTLREPVLDVGCGAAAALVTSLRGRGLDATGLDRYAAAPHTIAQDWSSYRFEPGRWGTVISHLALSLHFVHRHHGADDALAQRSARKYMEVLGSLQLGGRFIYAPSAPFIEDVLPRARFEVRRLPVSAPALAAQPQLASTSWVTRLA